MTAARTVLVLSNHAEIVGGGERSLLTLLKGLDASRWSACVVVPAEGAVATQSRKLGVPTHVIPLPSLRRPRPLVPKSLVALRRLARDVAASVLHANGSRAMAYAGVVGRLVGRPVIWHVRILEPDPLLDWLLARLATRTIAISQAVRGRLRRWPEPYRRCVVVPNGIDVEAFVPTRDPAAVRRALGLPESAPVVGTVGRLVPFKGHTHLLDAFALLRERQPDAHLMVVGDGPERTSLESRARERGLAARVRFTGHREDVADLMSVMDVFALPSLAEHFGRVLLEAMVMERPIVATAAGGVPEIVEHTITGLLVPPADPPALAQAVLMLLADPARAAALGRAGRQRLEGRYDLAAHARAVEAVYDDAARRVA